MNYVELNLIRMKNIFINSQFVHFKYIRQISLCRIPANPFFRCVGCNSLNVLKTDVNGKNFRYVHLSAGQFKTLSEKSKENPVIYYGSLTGNIKGVKVFSCITSIGGFIAQPWIWQNASVTNNLPIQVALLTCIGFFTYVTPFLIHSVTRKYVTEIRYDSTSDTYTATVLSFFLRRININFKKEDVHIPTYQPLFTTMIIKGKPVFINSDCFFDIQHYIKMMGYDKPLDLHLSSPPNGAHKSPGEM